MNDTTTDTATDTAAPRPTGPMTGKTVLVTGSTGGIGKATAAALVRLGAQVWIVGRHADRAAAVQTEIGAAGHLVADLSLRGEAVQMAQDFAARVGALDVLVNNAGAVYDRRQETREGIEMTWALNHLGYFIVTRELLGLLRLSRGRVVNVSSAAHAFGRMRWQDQEFKSGYRGWAAYGQSKLANVLFTRELAYRERESGVTANALHPGLVTSGFGLGDNSATKHFYNLAAPFILSSERGAQTSIYLASSSEVQGMSGLYFAKSRVKAPESHALDDAAGKRLWTLSESYLE